MASAGHTTQALANATSFFNGQRLTMARQLAGLRKARLAELIGMSPASVTGWESGAKRPNRATVAKLALALRVEPQFFAGGPLPTLRSHTSVRCVQPRRSLRTRRRLTANSSRRSPDSSRRSLNFQRRRCPISPWLQMKLMPHRRKWRVKPGTSSVSHQGRSNTLSGWRSVLVWSSCLASLASRQSTPIPYTPARARLSCSIL